MTPDINAGAWYLRGRFDGSWDVCEPTTGEPFAEVTVDPETYDVTAYGDPVAGDAGTDAVRRYLLQLVAQPGQRPGQ